MWFSAGVSSTMALWLARKEVDEIIYIHIDDQHEDTMRFVRDVEVMIGKPITAMQSPYRSVDAVIQQFRFIKSAFGAKCTDILKRRVRKEWESKQDQPLRYIWGMDACETGRAERLKAAMPTFSHLFPLIEHGISKDEAHAMARKLGMKRPAIYDMGYKNNNCLGCVKGGMFYWNKIRRDFPAVFERMAKREREIGRSCLKECFLDELHPERGKPDDLIFGDCGIFCIS